MKSASFLIASAIAVALAGAANVHVVLEKREAVGSYYKAVFQVGHGCDGSATIGLAVAIPDNVIAVKPMEKPGWSLRTTSAAYASPHRLHGKPVSEGVRDVVWSGGRLADERYDEFVMMVHLTDRLPADSTLYFPVTQRCEAGEARWTAIPEAGKPPPATPAPGLRLLAAPQRHQH